MTCHALPPRPALVRKAPGSDSVNGVWTSFGLPFTLQPDGTWLYSGKADFGTETIDGQPYRIELRLVPLQPAPPPPPPPPLPAHIHGYLGPTGTALWAVKPGDSIAIEGTGLGDTDMVSFGTARVSPARVTPAAVTVVVPSLPSGSVAVKLYRHVAGPPSSWALIAADGPALFITAP